MEPFRINRNMHDPIEEYCEVLNYCSQNYGTPISIRVKSENELLNNLEEVYSVALTRMSHIISDGRDVKLGQGKYNFVEFQRDFMNVNPNLLERTKKGRVSSNKKARRRIDKESPNFMNSLHSLWKDLDSRRKIDDVANNLEVIEGQLNIEGEPLSVIRPVYEIKDDGTYRITTNTPNLQGLATMYKEEFLKPEKGRVFVGADISSQEANIFFNSICRDEDILRMYQELGDIYTPVIAKIEGIEPEMVDRELRSIYKVGILAKMNAGGIFLLSRQMGNRELAQKLDDFVENNPNYIRFTETINRQLLSPQPRMGGFIKGRERVLTSKDRGFNKLANAPLQITAISFFSISFFALLEQLMKECSEWKTIEDLLLDVRPVYHAHDEIVLSVANKNGYPELVQKMLKWALEVHYEDWVPFKADPYVSEYYIH